MTADKPTSVESLVLDGIEMAQVGARGVPVSVVAAKKPGAWIVRGMSPFASWEVLFRSVTAFTGRIDSELEWTYCTYGVWPGYVVYGEGDIKPTGWPTGVYRFDHKGGEVYGPAIRLGDVR